MTTLDTEIEAADDEITNGNVAGAINQLIIISGDTDHIKVKKSLENLNAASSGKENMFPAEVGQTPVPVVDRDNTASSVELDQHEVADLEQGGIRDTVIAGRDVYRLRVGKVFANLFQDPDWKGLAQRNRHTMLAKMQRFWIDGVLERSLHELTMIELGMVEQSCAVDNPFKIILTQLLGADSVLPAGTRIDEVFEQSGRALLILGEPGSGKTTMLLSLAAAKICSAQQDATQPLPVVFNLSSWSASRKEIAEWLVDELRVKYRVPPRVGRAWIGERGLLLLLDGLDEVEPDFRNACVQALNVFGHEYGLQNIVVCSRVADYQSLVTRLNLQNAVLLEPLTSDQVDAYLRNAGDELAAVRALLDIDLPLQELARSPLTLNVMALAYRGKTSQELQSFASVAERRHHLFDTYVAHMFSRVVRTKSRAYSSSQTASWLAWLAGQMSRHSMSEFLVELLQPSWLSTCADRRVYFIISRLVAAALLGLGVGLLNVGLGGTPGMRSVMGSWTDIVAYLFSNKLLNFLLGIVLGTIGGIAIGFFDARRLIPCRQTFTPKPSFGVSRETARSLVTFMLMGLILGIVDGLAVQLILGNNSWSFIFAEDGRLVPDPVPLFRQLIFSGGIMGSLLGTLVIGPSLCLIFELRNHERQLTTDVRTVETLTWSWSDLVKGAVGTGFVMDVSVSVVGFLVLVLAFAAELAVDTINGRWGSGISFSSIAWIILKAFVGAQLLGLLVGGPFGMLVGGPVNAVRGRIIDRKSIVNQGIRQSARNAAIGATVFPATSGCTFLSLFVLGPMVLMLSMLLVSLPLGRFAAVKEEILVWPREFVKLFGALGAVNVLALFLPDFIAFIVGILGSIGVVAALWYGAFAVIQHFTLRLMLWIRGKTPWNYSRFLDHATERVFLQKVGGGYIFVHRLLLEHFAAMQPLEVDQEWCKQNFIGIHADAPSGTQAHDEHRMRNGLVSGERGCWHGLQRHSLRFYGAVIISLQAAILLLLSGLVVVATDPIATRQQLQQWGWIGDAFDNGQDKFLVVIARFDSSEATVDTGIHRQIQESIAQAIQELGLPGVSVEVKRNRLGDDDRTEAQTLGSDFDANVIIWGAIDGSVVTANVLNLKAPDSDAAEARIVEPTSNAEQLAREVAFLVLFALGQSYESQNAHNDSAKVIEMAIQTLPSTAALLEDLATAYLHLGWLYESDDDARAVAMYSKAIELNPAYADAYRYRASIRRIEGDLEGAILDYSMVIELQPSDDQAYFKRGSARSTCGDLDGAIADFSHVIVNDPSNAAAYNNRGLAWAKQSNFAPAIKDYSKAIELNPELTMAYRNRGIARYLNGDGAGAVADFTRVIEFSPSDAYMYLWRGTLLLKQGDMDEAQSDFKEATIWAPTDAYVYTAICWYYDLVQQPKAAMPYCQKGIDLGDSPGHRDARGLTYALLGDYQSAITDFEAAIEWAEQQEDSDWQAKVTSMKGWVTELKAGRNPFTDDLLLRLWNE